MKIINEALLDTYRGPGKCEWCGNHVNRREPHHLFCRGIGGGGRIDHPWNLVALCAAFSGGADCHARVHSGEIARHDLLAVVAAREGVLQHQIEQKIWEIRRSPRGAAS